MVNPYDVQEIIQNSGVEEAIAYLTGAKYSNASRWDALRYLRAWSYLWPDTVIPEQ